MPCRIHSTPLLANPRRPSLYYVNMTGIRVIGRPIRIPPKAFAFDLATDGSTIIDSGTMFTRSMVPAYEAVRDDFRPRVMAQQNDRVVFDGAGGRLSIACEHCTYGDYHVL
ncbi:hypothetical protein COCNU_07G009330 [Cocos nucifera]|uniref:Xylanase inhibitor C-terminal domain-containing protein n=1 Tax=Cocos nucifera TaxID=13894 RepID=A0A8K0IFD9_COCNU|nr:hypothetical protein COCNU_07G009330 [Cocos nucifera]